MSVFDGSPTIVVEFHRFVCKLALVHLNTRTVVADLLLDPIETHTIDVRDAPLSPAPGAHRLVGPKNECLQSARDNGTSNHTPSNLPPVIFGLGLSQKE